MKKRNVIYLFLFLSFTFLSGQKSFEKKEWVFKGDTLKYQILYPQKMKDGKTYPLVLFLHGSGERGDDNEKQLTHGSELFLEEKNRSKYPAIVLFPQCPKGIMWTHRMKEKTKGGDWVFNFPLENQPTKPAFLVNQLVESLLLSGKVDKQRVYVMGLSMGGIGTLEFLARWPQKYAAANVICGGHDPALAKKYGEIPIRFFHGDRDEVVPYKYSYGVYEVLRQLNGKTRYTLYSGVNHNSWDVAFAEPDFLKWMFKIKKK